MHSMVGMPLESIWKIQWVQSTAAKLLTGADHQDHITPLLLQLLSLLICFGAQFKVLVLTYEALNNLSLSYRKGSGSLYEPAEVLKSSEEAFFLVPLAASVHLVRIQERAFSFAALRLWNSLPQEARLVLFLLSFHKQTKTFLFKQAFL